MTRDVAEIAAAAQLACLLEASAPKPGNVSPGRHFDDTRFEDFLASAAAIGAPLLGIGTRPLGATIRLAVEASRRWTRANTNLGIVLLLVPLARATLELSPARQDVGAVDFFTALRGAVRQVLAEATVDDACDVYAAIRTAAPGGLGHVGEQDVSVEPTVPLLEAMRLAADRDGIAREYATAFETTFTVGAPALVRARRDALPWDDAVVETFLALLAEAPDTHIARRGGPALAAEVWQRARGALAQGSVRTPDGRRAIEELDTALRGPHNTANPGTTADLTAAAVFSVILWEKS